MNKINILRKLSTQADRQREKERGGGRLWGPSSFTPEPLHWTGYIQQQAENRGLTGAERCGSGVNSQAAARLRMQHGPFPKTHLLETFLYFLTRPLYFLAVQQELHSHHALSGHSLYVIVVHLCVRSHTQVYYVTHWPLSLKGAGHACNTSYREVTS